MSFDFAGDDFLSGILEKQTISAPRRGRPSRLDDATLEHRRNVLVGVLENGWGLVGWQLQTATTTAEIRAALEPVSQWRSEFSVFIRVRAATSQRQLRREAQKRLDECQTGSRLEHQRLQALREAAQRSGAALHELRAALRDLRSGVGNEGQIEQVGGQIYSMDREHAVREQHASEQKERVERVEREEETAKEGLLDAEADFSQTELLRFMLSGRYQLIPLNFANAMAGLPYMGWRQSFKRCLRCNDAHTESVAYDQFKIIATALRSEKAKGASLEEAIRASLLRASAEKDFALLELRKNWYYVRRAIEMIDLEALSADEVPYRITAMFSRLTQSRSALDMLREEEERL